MLKLLMREKKEEGGGGGEGGVRTTLFPGNNLTAAGKVTNSY